MIFFYFYNKFPRQSGHQVPNHGLDDDPRLINLMRNQVTEALRIDGKQQWNFLASDARAALEGAIFASAYDTGE